MVANQFKFTTILAFAVLIGLFTVHMAAAVPVLEISHPTGGDLLALTPQTIRFNVTDLLSSLPANFLAETVALGNPWLSTAGFCTSNSTLVVQQSPSGSGAAEFSTALIVPFQHFASQKFALGKPDGSTFPSECFIYKRNTQLKRYVGTARAYVNAAVMGQTNPILCDSYIQFDSRLTALADEEGTAVNFAHNIDVYCENMTVYPSNIAYEQGVSAMGAAASPMVTTQTDYVVSTYATALIPLWMDTAFAPFDTTPMEVMSPVRFPNTKIVMPAQPTVVQFEQDPILLDNEIVRGPSEARQYDIDQYKIEITVEAVGLYTLLMATQIPFLRSLPDRFHSMGMFDRAVLPLMDRDNREIVGYVSTARRARDEYNQEKINAETPYTRFRRSLHPTSGYYKGPFYQTQTSTPGRDWTGANGNAPEWTEFDHHTGTTWWMYDVVMLKPVTTGLLQFQLSSPLLSPAIVLTSQPFAPEFTNFTAPFLFDSYRFESAPNFKFWTNNLEHSFTLDPRLQLVNDPNIMPPQKVVSGDQTPSAPMKTLQTSYPSNNYVSYNNYHLFVKYINLRDIADAPLQPSPIEFSYRIASDTPLITFNNVSTPLVATHYIVTVSDYYETLRNHYQSLAWSSPQDAAVNGSFSLEFDFYTEEMVCYPFAESTPALGKLAGELPTYDLDTNGEVIIPTPQEDCRVEKTPLHFPVAFDAYAPLTHSSTDADFSKVFQTNQFVNMTQFFSRVLPSLSGTDPLKQLSLDDSLRNGWACPFVPPETPGDYNPEKTASFTFSPYHVNPATTGDSYAPSWTLGMDSGLYMEPCVFHLYVPAMVSTKRQIKIRTRVVAEQNEPILLGSPDVATSTAPGAPEIAAVSQSFTPQQLSINTYFPTLIRDEYLSETEVGRLSRDESVVNTAYSFQRCLDVNAALYTDLEQQPFLESVIDPVAFGVPWAHEYDGWTSGNACGINPVVGGWIDDGSAMFAITKDSATPAQSANSTKPSHSPRRAPLSDQKIRDHFFGEVAKRQQNAAGYWADHPEDAQAYGIHDSASTLTPQAFTTTAVNSGVVISFPVIDMVPLSNPTTMASFIDLYTDATFSENLYIEGLDLDPEVELHLSYLSAAQPIHPLNPITQEYFCAVYPAPGLGPPPATIFLPLIPNPFIDSANRTHYPTPGPMGPFILSESYRYRYNYVPTADDKDKMNVLYHAKTKAVKFSSFGPHVDVVCNLPRARDILNQVCEELGGLSASTSCNPVTPSFLQFKYKDELLHFEPTEPTAINGVKLGAYVGTPLRGIVGLPQPTPQPPIDAPNFIVQDAAFATQADTTSPESAYTRGYFSFLFRGQIILTPDLEQYILAAFKSGLKRSVAAAISLLDDVPTINVDTQITPFIVQLKDIVVPSVRLGRFAAEVDDKSAYLDASHWTLIEIAPVDTASIKSTVDPWTTHTTNLLTELFSTLKQGQLDALPSNIFLPAHMNREVVIGMNVYFKDGINSGSSTQRLAFSNGSITLEPQLQANIFPIYATGALPLMIIDAVQADMIPSEVPWGVKKSLLAINQSFFRSTKVSPSCFTRKQGTCGVAAAASGADDVRCDIQCPVFSGYQAQELVASGFDLSLVKCESNTDCSRDLTSQFYQLPVAQCIDSICQTTQFARFEQSAPIRGGISPAEPLQCPANQLLGSDGYSCIIQPQLSGFRSENYFPPQAGANNRGVPLPGDPISFAWDYTGRGTNLATIYVKLGEERYQVVPVVAVGEGIAHGTWPELPQQAASSTPPPDINPNITYTVPTSTTQPLLVMDFLSEGDLEVAPQRINNDDRLRPAALFSVAACQSLNADGTYIDQCENAGTCNTNTGLCSCLEGFSGSLCDKSQCYDDFTCNIPGTVKCAKSDDITKQCTCKPGWSGSLCEHYNVCSTTQNQAKLQCRNGGSIVPINATVPEAEVQCNLNECNCIGYWAGRRCESCSLQCFNGGSVIGCNMCQCPQDSFGDFCQCKGKTGSVTYSQAPDFITSTLAAPDPKSFDQVKFNEWSKSFTETLRFDLSLSPSDIVSITSFDTVGNNMVVKFNVYYNCDTVSSTTSSELQTLFLRFSEVSTNYFSAVRNAISSTIADGINTVDDLTDLKCTIDPEVGLCTLPKETPLTVPYKEPNGTTIVTAMFAMFLATAIPVLF